MLHSQTTLILAAFLFLALPVMVWLALRPASDQAVAWWCAGGLAAGLGIVLMGLRPWLPAVVSYQVANICVLGSMVFWAQSLRTTQGRAWSRGQVLVWLLLGAGFYSALLAWCSPAQRGLWMRLALGLLSLYTAWCAFRLSRQIRQEASQRSRQPCQLHRPLHQRPAAGRRQLVQVVPLGMGDVVLVTRRAVGAAPALLVDLTLEGAAHLVHHPDRRRADAHGGHHRPRIASGCAPCRSERYSEDERDSTPHAVLPVGARWYVRRGDAPYA